MWRKNALAILTSAPWRTIALRRSSSVSYAVNSTILRSLKDHFLDATRVSPPPKMNPPEPFEVVNGAMSGKGPVLRRIYGAGEEITVSASKVSAVHGADDDDDDITGELFIRVEVSKASEDESLLFLCGLYPDAFGIDAVHLVPKKAPLFDSVVPPTAYHGPGFRDLDKEIRDLFHKYIEERGVNEGLFPFLQVWLYVNEQKKLLRWLKSVGTFIRDDKPSEDA